MSISAYLSAFSVILIHLKTYDFKKYGRKYGRTFDIKKDVLITHLIFSFEVEVSTSYFKAYEPDNFSYTHKAHMSATMTYKEDKNFEIPAINQCII